MTESLPPDILQRAAHIRLAVFDVDGVLTDGRLWFAPDGRELKAFHVHDGLGMKRLMACGIEVAIITGRRSLVVTERMAELGVAHVYQGQDDKRACLDGLCHALGIGHAAVAYTGDDLPDLPAMRVAGLAIAVANARPEVASQSHWQTCSRGGCGAAREVCDLLLAAQAQAAGAGS